MAENKIMKTLTFKNKDGSSTTYEICDERARQELVSISNDVDDLKKGGTVVGNVQSDWNQEDETAPNYVKNRTHYITKGDIVWNGLDTEDRDIIDISSIVGKEECIACKIDEQVFTKDIIDNIVIEFLKEPNYYNFSYVIEKDDELSLDLNSTLVRVFHVYTNTQPSIHEAAFLILSTSLEEDLTDTLGITIPSKGTYCSIYNGYVGGTVVIKESKDVYQPLDEKFIPESIARNSEIESKVETVLQEAMESGEFNGVGIEKIEPIGIPIVGAEYIDIGVYLTDGTVETFSIKNGVDGKDGEDGVGIERVDFMDGYMINPETYEEKLSHTTVVFRLTNGESYQFNVQHGKGYILTAQDKQEIADLIGASIVDGNEVKY